MQENKIVQLIQETFRAEHNLVNFLRSGDGLEDVYTPTWTYYETLQPSVKTEPTNQKLLSMSKKKNQIAEELLQMENKNLSLIEQSLNSKSTRLPWIGRHTRDHVSSTPLNWNNRDCRDCHTQSVTAGSYSSEIITHPPRNLHCGPSLTGGNYHRAVTPRPSVTVTLPPRDLHSGTLLTGDDLGQ
ncbi:hypothetical protein TSAR_006952, partial [Trichomalopsis sarcophagae]